MRRSLAKQRILAALAVSLMASGAQAGDVETALGGGLGAAAGAAIGQSVSKKNGAVIGGAVGGATGAAVGKSVGGSSGAVVGAGVGGATGAVVGKNISTSSGTAVGSSEAPHAPGGQVSYRGNRYDHDDDCYKWKHKKHPGKGWAKGHYKKKC